MKVRLQNIELDDIRAVFSPKNFRERYRYLGSVPYDTDGLFPYLMPLVVAMDYKAKPKWCPRWVLRFLHLFGNDNSMIRVRNWKLHELSKKLTGGIMLVDYKLKWTNYDLRISILGDDTLNWLADAIELKYYRDGQRIDLIDQILRIYPNYDGLEYKSICELKELLQNTNTLNTDVDNEA